MMKNLLVYLLFGCVLAGTASAQEVTVLEFIHKERSVEYTRITHHEFSDVYPIIIFTRSEDDYKILVDRNSSCNKRKTGAGHTMSFVVLIPKDTNSIDSEIDFITHTTTALTNTLLEKPQILVLTFDRSLSRTASKLAEQFIDSEKIIFNSYKTADKMCSQIVSSAMKKIGRIRKQEKTDRK
jgi:hypothetical protein